MKLQLKVPLGQMSSGTSVFRLKAVRGVSAPQPDTQGKAPVGEVLADPPGRNAPGGEVGALTALGRPSGEVGVCAAPPPRGPDIAQGSHMPRSSSWKDEKGCASGKIMPDPVGFSPEPVNLGEGVPNPVGFSPETINPGDGVPEPLRFRPDPTKREDSGTGHLVKNQRKRSRSTGIESSLCRLPLAVFACRAVVPQTSDESPVEIEIEADDSSFYAAPGIDRVAGEHLDRVLRELRVLCSAQRRIVLEEAASGVDCQLEAQELNRLLELEEDTVRELLEVRGEPLLELRTLPGPQDTRQSELLCSLKGDVGGGCEAQVEGTAGAPLQTKIIAVEDVLRDLDSWWTPMLAEYEALVHEKQVVVPVTAEELARREGAGEAFQVIPAKLIFTLKAFTARRRVRCVACGNYLGEGVYTADQLYAGGLDIISLRCCLVLMVRKGWSAGVIDIKTAFLNAELEEEDLGTKRVIVRTPGLWRRLGVCTETFWDVRRALYGLQISPAAWSRCRDRTLPRLRLQTCCGTVRLVQLKSDGNIWMMVPDEAIEPIDPSLRLGLLLVYVDDIMVLSTPALIADVIAELRKTWELSTPELLEEGSVHYRGVEIRKGEGGVLVHQESYTRDLLMRHPDKGSADVPALKLPEVKPLENQDPKTVRNAQQIAGELLWLSGLTRPELQFAVGNLSRTISTNAEEALAMGAQVIKYLRRYPSRGLWYGTASMSWGDEGDLSRPMSGDSLVGFCDASFAPSGSRSLQSTLAYYSGGLVAWSATRQSLTTLSTAESELVGITSLFTDLRALEPLVQEIHGSPVSLHLHSDSQAAIAICSTQANNWRTRHLRIRASYVREALESGHYTLNHISGNSMIADIGTKPLPAPRFQQLVHAMGMVNMGETVDNKVARSVVCEETIKAILVSLVVASLIQPTAGHYETSTEPPRSLAQADWQFLLLVVVGTVCCWEVFKIIVKWVSSSVSWLIRGFWSLVLGKCKRERVQVIHHVDDVAVIGPRHLLAQHLEDARRETEAVSASERPGPLSPTRVVRRRSSTVCEFQFVPEVFDDWPSTVSLHFQVVGQDRYELSTDGRAVIRWHCSPRVRLFTPEGTRPPVAVTLFTGRRRTYIIDASAQSGRGIRYHADNWRIGSTPQGYVHFQWVGCTELEISVPE